MPRLISQAELSRLAGVSETAISKAVKKQLAPARVGNRIDLDHSATKRYLASKGVRPDAPKPSSPPRPAQPRAAAAAAGSSPPAASEPTEPAATADAAGAQRGVRVVAHEIDNVDDIADMTIRQVVKQFGSVTSFKDWLLSLKQIEDIREKRLRNEESEGRLISRELVKTHVFGAIEATNRRLLGDSPKTIARRVYALANSGSVLEEGERTVREIISSHLGQEKIQVSKALRRE